MQRIVQVSLNRNPWSIEVDAHERLEVYLSESAAALASDPDRDEILLDLEQAIAEQCKRRLSANATVISMTELAPALEEIGPVNPSSSAGATPCSPTASSTPPLQQISQGAWISGVCVGLSRHLRLEVTLVRVIAVVLLFFTGGAALLLYGVLMLLIPFAPLDPQLPDPLSIPAKAREWTAVLRAKLAKLAR